MNTLPINAICHSLGRESDFYSSSPFDDLPVEPIFKILSEVAVSSDRNTLLVCKSWRQVVPKLPELNLSIFGQAEWKEFYGFDIDNDPCQVPENIKQHARCLRRRFSGEEEAPLCSLFLIPKGLTLNKLKACVQNPLKGPVTKFHKDSWAAIFQELGRIKNDKSYWVLMTRDIIKGAKNLGYEVQKKRIAEKGGFDCQPIYLIEAAVCCFTYYVTTGNYLFGANPTIFTRCQDWVLAWPIVVGDYSAEGLRVLRKEDGGESVGLAVCRKFLPEKEENGLHSFRKSD